MYKEQAQYIITISFSGYRADRDFSSILNEIRSMIHVHVPIQNILSLNIDQNTYGIVPLKIFPILAKLVL